MKFDAKDEIDIVKKAHGALTVGLGAIGNVLDHPVVMRLGIG